MEWGPKRRGNARLLLRGGVETKWKRYRKPDTYNLRMLRQRFRFTTTSQDPLVIFEKCGEFHVYSTEMLATKDKRLRRMEEILSGSGES